MQTFFYCLLLQHGCNAQTLYTDTVKFNKEYLSLKLTTNSNKTSPGSLVHRQENIITLWK